MCRSECCGAKSDEDYKICSKCLEHCDIWYEEDDE
jgi:hypothetical protein